MSTPSCSASCGNCAAPSFIICRVCALEVGHSSGGCSAMMANVAITYLLCSYESDSPAAPVPGLFHEDGLRLPARRYCREEDRAPALPSPWQGLGERLAR